MSEQEARIPRLAKGRRPVYGKATPQEVNQLLAAVTALTAEVSVLRQRVRTLETLGERAGWLTPGSVDGHEAGPAEREEQALWNEGLLSRVFYLSVETPAGARSPAQPEGQVPNPPGAAPPAQR